jgi:hypothetical protein
VNQNPGNPKSNKLLGNVAELAWATPAGPASSSSQPVPRSAAAPPCLRSLAGAPGESGSCLSVAAVAAAAIP